MPLYQGGQLFTTADDVFRQGLSIHSAAISCGSVVADSTINAAPILAGRQPYLIAEHRERNCSRLRRAICPMRLIRTRPISTVGSKF